MSHTKPNGTKSQLLFPHIYDKSIVKENENNPKNISDGKNSSEKCLVQKSVSKYHKKF
jgi:hypothetical protein